MQSNLFDSLGKPFSDVQFHYNKNFKLIYLTAIRLQTSNREIFIPITKYESINLNRIADLRSEFASSSCTNLLNLAIVDSNQVILYYRLTNEFVDLDCLPGAEKTETDTSV